MQALLNVCELVCMSSMFVCDSHLQELRGRQVDVGVYYLKAGAQVLCTHLYNRKTNKQKKITWYNSTNLNL